MADSVEAPGKAAGRVMVFGDAVQGQIDVEINVGALVDNILDCVENALGQRAVGGDADLAGRGKTIKGGDEGSDVAAEEGLSAGKEQLGQGLQRPGDFYNVW